MNDTIPASYEWVKQIPSSLMELDDKPLFGKGPSFPWESFSSAIAKIFDKKELSIRPAEMQWRLSDQLLDGLGADPIITNIVFSGLEGNLTWAISRTELEPLMQQLLSIPITPFVELDKEFEEGFYRFVLSQVLYTIKQLDFDKNLSPSLTENNELNKETAFCVNIVIDLQQQTFRGRLIISKELRTSWKERYAERKLDSVLASSLAHKATVTIHLEGGKTALLPSELAEITLGDYILLDSCSYEPDADKGRVMMTVGGIPLFRAKLKQGSLKILEFPLYHEEQLNMNNNKDNDEDFEEHTFEEHTTEESELEELTDDDFLEDDASEIEEQSEISTVENSHESPAEEEHIPSAAPAEPVKVGKVNIQELPVNVVIEVGRIQISLQKLMELTPGNMLDVDIIPENGVDLVVNGKRIGKGELIRIGETLGVRVLDLG